MLTLIWPLIIIYGEHVSSEAIFAEVNGEKNGLSAWLIELL